MPTRQGQPTGLQFIDRWPIRVCHTRRLSSPRVLAGLAQRGKGSRGWFYGCKLPRVIQEQGEWLGLSLTPGQVEERRPVRTWVRPLWGQLFGDRGSIRQEWFEPLGNQDLQLSTKLKRNRKNKWMPRLDKVLLRKRALIECVKDQWKNSSQIEHTRHRSATNGIVKIWAAVVADTFQPKKPALDLFTKPDKADQQLLLAAMMA